MSDSKVLWTVSEAERRAERVLFKTGTQCLIISPNSAADKTGGYSNKIRPELRAGIEGKSDLIMSRPIYPTVHFPTTCSAV